MRPLTGEDCQVIGGRGPPQGSSTTTSGCRPETVGVSKGEWRPRSPFLEAGVPGVPGRRGGGQLWRE